MLYLAAVILPRQALLLVALLPLIYARWSRPAPDDLLNITAAKEYCEYPHYADVASKFRGTPACLDQLSKNPTMVAKARDLGKEALDKAHPFIIHTVSGSNTARVCLCVFAGHGQATAACRCQSSADSWR